MSEEIAYAFGATVECHGADLLKALSGVEGIRGGIGRLRVHFANDARLAQLFGPFEETRIQQASESKPPLVRGYHAWSVCRSLISIVIDGTLLPRHQGYAQRRLAGAALKANSRHPD